ncbi:hypothetical protein [Rossellomorea marisflavi]|nr:hypothetical protein [Rossellomorea marisflavi]
MACQAKRNGVGRLVGPPVQAVCEDGRKLTSDKRTDLDDMKQPRH